MTQKKKKTYVRNLLKCHHPNNINRGIGFLHNSQMAIEVLSGLFLTPCAFSMSLEGGTVYQFFGNVPLKLSCLFHREARRPQMWSRGRLNTIMRTSLWSKWYNEYLWHSVSSLLGVSVCVSGYCVLSIRDICVSCCDTFSRVYKKCAHTSLISYSDELR